MNSAAAQANAASPSPPPPPGGGGTIVIVVVAVVAIVAILGTIYYVKAKNPSKIAPTTGPQVNVAQPQPATNPATNMPVMAVPVPSMPAEVTPQPSGAMFDPNTGQPIPKFDPVTGAQNW